MTVRHILYDCASYGMNYASFDSENQLHRFFLMTGEEYAAEFLRNISSASSAAPSAAASSPAVPSFLADVLSSAAPLVSSEASLSEDLLSSFSAVPSSALVPAVPLSASVASSPTEDETKKIEEMLVAAKNQGRSQLWSFSFDKVYSHHDALKSFFEVFKILVLKAKDLGIGDVPFSYRKIEEDSNVLFFIGFLIALTCGHIAFVSQLGLFERKNKKTLTSIAYRCLLLLFIQEPLFSGQKESDPVISFQSTAIGLDIILRNFKDIYYSNLSGDDVSSFDTLETMIRLSLENCLSAVEEVKDKMNIETLEHSLSRVRSSIFSIKF